jgi:hypothetical protein
MHRYDDGITSDQIHVVALALVAGVLLMIHVLSA